jgi:hypothetical protein
MGRISPRPSPQRTNLTWPDATAFRDAIGRFKIGGVGVGGKALLAGVDGEKEAVIAAGDPAPNIGYISKRGKILAYILH